MIEFELNGKTVTSESPPDTPVLWVIRDELKLKGTKFGCLHDSHRRRGDALLRHARQ